MSITKETELIGMKKVSDVVAYALKEMKDFADPVFQPNNLTTTELKYCRILVQIPHLIKHTNFPVGHA